MNPQNTTLVAHIDMAGGGQVWVDGTTLYVGHMSAPHGTTIVDVADPRKPRVLTSLEVPAGYHSHKVRVANNTMLVNHELVGRDDGANFGGGGLGIYDVSNPARPSPCYAPSGKPAEKASIAFRSTDATRIFRRRSKVTPATS